MTTSQVQVPPVLQPPIGKTAQEEEVELKGQVPAMVKGATAEIPAELKDAYDYALMAIGYWEEQKTLVLNQIRRNIGDAQTATVNGVPVAQRRVFTRKEYVVPATEIDAFWPVKSSTAH